MDSVSAKVTIDLSPIEDDRTTLDGKVLFDHNDQPDELELDLTGADAATLNKLFGGAGMSLLDGQSVDATLEDGRLLKSSIALAHGCTPTHTGSITLRASLGQATITDPTSVDTQPVLWQFRLSNVKLALGDAVTHHPLPPDADPARIPRGWTRNKLPFSVAGREWVLIDDFMGRWSKKEKPDVAIPLMTARLETAFQAHDTRESVTSAGDDIAVVLTLALGRDVRCVACSRVDGNGAYIDTLARNLLVHPFNSGGQAVVNNWEPGILRPFIETASSAIVKERDWWHKTLGLYQLVQVNKYLEIKCAILNILVDRIAAKHSDTVGAAQIDEKLPARLDDGFERRLHDLLSELSSHWDERRTRRLIETIKEWNARPSFGENIRQVCGKLRIPQPSGRFLATRHKLLHLGDLSPTEGTMGEYFTELEWLVLALILCLLGYDGEFYHHKLGSERGRLGDLLVSPSLDAPT